MDVKFINPFLESSVNIIATMATVDSTAGRPSVKKKRFAKGDVTGIAEMKGEQVTGSIALSFQKDVILQLTEQLLEEKVTEIGEDVIDAVGELTNMVMGGAKNLLSQQGYQFEMSVPSVVTGDKHEIHHKSTGPTIVIPFETTFGYFFIEICFAKVE